MKRKAYFLPEPLIRKLDELAERTDTAVAEHVRNALLDYLAKWEKEHASKTKSIHPD